MVWIGGYSQIISSLLAGWCLVFSGFVSAGAVVPSPKLPHGTCLSAESVPAVDFSDTAVQRVAYRLLQAESHLSAGLAAVCRLSGVHAPSRAIRSLIYGGAFPVRDSLLDLGIALRL